MPSELGRGRVVLSAVAFHLAWLACVVGAGRGNGWVGPVAVAAHALLHATVLTATLREDLRRVAIAVALGVVVDGGFQALRLMTYHAAILPTPAPPLWILALWVNFALSFGGCLSWLRGRSRAAAVLGAVGGPLSYLAGVRLGAIQFSASAAVVLTTLALVWAATTVFLARLPGNHRPKLQT